MSMETNTAATPSGLPCTVHDGRAILFQEGRALISLAQRLDGAFDRAVAAIMECRGTVLLSGMGKAGLVGRKISATLSSLGTPSHFLHPAEAIHGDLGCVHGTDVVLALSYSGQTEEVVRLVAPLRERGCRLLAMTGNPGSRLGRNADVVLDLGRIEEAGSLSLAPTTSTTLMMGMGDALALVVSQQRRFRAEDFARNHPGGSLGRRLARVEEVMRPLNECRIAHQHSSVRDVLVQQRVPGRRSGAVMVIDDRGLLAGIFTDSDLARLLERKHDFALDRPIAEVMTRGPQTIGVQAWLADAVQLLALRKISELPVLDNTGRPAGMIDITDVVAASPATAATRPAVERIAPTPGQERADEALPIIPFTPRCDGELRT